MSEKPARFASEEAVSGVVVRVPQPGAPALVVVHEPIAVELLEAPIDERLDAMLARLHDRDFLGAFVLAESVNAVREHGLATICRNEAFSSVRPILESEPAQAILRAGSDRVAALRELHERLHAGAL